MKRIKKKISKTLSGLTIVELLAATVLASMLMISVVTTIHTMNQTKKKVLEQEKYVPWLNQFVEQLEWELKNSSRLVITPAEFQLIGFNGRDFQNRTSTHVRSLISYGIVTKEEHSCLIRREIHPDSLNLDNEYRELVGTDISRVVLTSSEVSSNIKKNPKLIPEQLSYDDIVPKQIALLIYLKDNPIPVLNHVYSLQ